MDRLSADCELRVFEFLTLRELLAVQSSCGRARRHFDPRVWRAVRPPNSFFRQRFARDVGIPLSSLQQLHAAYSFTPSEVMRWRLILHARDSETVQWLVEQFGLHRRIDEVLCGACARGSLKFAQWLVEHFGITTSNIRAKKNFALRKACANGHLHVAMWLVSHFHLTVRDIRVQHCYGLRYACENGHLAMAQWLADQFHLTANDASQRDDDALVSACRYGHLEVAQWLVARFGIVGDTSAVKQACAKGHLHVVQWLMPRLPRRLPGLYDEMLRGACAGGHLTLLEWLVDTHHLELDKQHLGLDERQVELDLRTAGRGPLAWQVDTRYLLRVACSNGHLHVAGYLMARVQAPSHNELIAALHDSCRNGHYEVVQWLVAHFAPDIRADALYHACANGHHEIAEWLVARADIQMDDYNTTRILETVCGRGHLAALQWFARQFEIPGTELRTWLGVSCWGGHVDVADWLADYCTHDNILALSIFTVVCRSAKLYMVQWFVGRFAPTVDQILKSDGLNWLRDLGHIGIVKWLIDHFAPDPRLVVSALADVPPTDTGHKNTATLRWLRARFAAV